MKQTHVGGVWGGAPQGSVCNEASVAKAALACTDNHYWVTTIVSEATRMSGGCSWWPLIQLQLSNNNNQYKQVRPLATLALLHTEPWHLN